MANEFEETPQWWFFTFGLDHAHACRYAKFYGTRWGAREQMIQRFGTRWSFQYGEIDKEEAIDRYELEELD